jgi:hypothetical protein
VPKALLESLLFFTFNFNWPFGAAPIKVKLFFSFFPHFLHPFTCLIAIFFINLPSGRLTDAVERRRGTVPWFHSPSGAPFFK